MQQKGEQERAAHPGLTRRELLQAGALVGLGAGALSTGALAAGCGSGGTASSASPSASGAAAIKPGGIMTLATDQLLPKDTLDPLKNITDGVDAVQGMLREGLVTRDFQFNPMPRLASSWETNADVTEYTFHIRPNVTWHDGTPFTAEDAQWSIRRILDPKAGSGMQQRLAGVMDASGVTVADAQTLKIKLKQPDALLPVALCVNQCYMTKANTKNFDDGNGTGPFKLKSWNPGESYEVEKFAGYWGAGEPILDGVRGVQIPEASTKLQSVASGSADVTQIAFDQLAVVKANPKLQIDPYDKGILYCTVCNCTTKPFIDNRVRQAIKLSVDRQKVIDIAYAGQGFASPDAPVAMGDPFMTAELIAATKMDRAKAKELMTAAGLANGLDLELKVPGDPLHANYGLAFARALEGSLFRVTTKQVPAATYWDTVWMKDPFFVDDWNRGQPVETMSLMVKSDAPWNESRFKSPEMDALLKTAYASCSSAELTASTSAACLYMSQNSGEVIPGYLNRLWVSRVGTTVVVWPTSMLNFRKMGFTA